MGFLTSTFFSWGLILQVIALVHFFRRRPDTYWVFVILFLGWIGALIYIVAEVIPDFQILNQSFKGISRGKRIRNLQLIIRDNPAAGNYEELGELYMESGNFLAARGAFDKAIAGHIDTIDAYYRRGVCALRLGDAQAAVADMEPVLAKDPDYDFHRAGGLLAHAYALTGQVEKSETLFRQVLVISTLSETYLNFAQMLAATGRAAEARQYALKVLEKAPTMPRYLRRRERPWFQQAKKLLRQLPG